MRVIIVVRVPARHAGADRVGVHCGAGAHIEIEPHAACPAAAALVSRVEQTLRDAFILRIPVRAAGPGTLPRFEMKARRWLVATGAHSSAR